MSQGGRGRGYRNATFRIAIDVNENGAKDHSYGHGVTLGIRNSWNESCEIIKHSLSVEELHDLRYLIDRAIAAAERAPVDTPPPPES